MPSSDMRGLLAGVGAFACWGALVLYWHVLDHVDPLELLAQRIVWSFVFMVPVTLCARCLPDVRAALADRGAVLRIFVSALLISANWGMYIYAVVSGHVLEASLGYFINPLVNVLLAFVFLGERLSRVQGCAIALAALGVFGRVAAGGSIPWLGLALAGTFAFYGFLRKTVRVESVPGLFLETGLLAPFALGLLLWLHNQGNTSFDPTAFFMRGADTRTIFLLVLSGIVTAVPLLLFTRAARALSLITLGLLQYLSPSITMLLGVCVLGAELDQGALLSFLCIWAALALYTWCTLRELRPRRP